MTKEHDALQMIAEVLRPRVMTAEVSGMNVVFGIRALRELGWSDQRIHIVAGRIMQH